MKVRILNREPLVEFSRDKASFENFAVNTYLANRKGLIQDSSYERSKGIIDVHLKHAFNKPLRHITPEEVYDYRRKRLEEVSPDTVRKELQLLSSIFRMALKLDKVALNPVSKVELPKPSPPRVRWIKDEEWQLLWPALRERDRSAVIFLINTGARRSELIGLTWNCVDFNNRTLFVPKSKNRKERCIHFNDTACGLLRGMERNKTSVLVFPEYSTGNALTIAFQRAVKRAGIQDFRLHDLRHSFASWLSMNGYDLRHIAELLGHSDIRMSMENLSPLVSLWYPMNQMTAESGVP